MCPDPSHSLPDDFARRFGGVGRLYGETVLAGLRRARVLIIGVGGVGSWTAEALARSGLGTIGLMDADDVCVTNTNRQVHTLCDSVGLPKVEAMARRLRAIHPDLSLELFPGYFGSASRALVTDGRWDVVVDAIDALPAKCLLLATCHAAGIPVVACGGAGGKRDGTQVRSADLADAVNDPLLRQTRKILRRDHGFPKGEGLAFGIPCVYSAEKPVFPRADGGVCATRDDSSSLRLDCASGFGTAAHVTGAFGLAAAGLALRRLAGSGLDIVP